MRWARETAGLDLTEAAAKIALGSARGVDAADRLAAIEAGIDEPSRPLLVKMAKQYHRPLLAFYMSSPPAKGSRGQDFRTLVDGSTPEDEATLDAFLRDFLARQSLIRAALEDEEERTPLKWVGSATMTDGVAPLVRDIRKSLKFDLPAFRETKSPDDAFKMLRDGIEQLGVYVVLASNLGSHHSTLGTDVFRGLAVADPFAPFVVVNDQDSRAAWSFTLLHELVHLWLGETGVSGGSPDRAVERFCNQVASEILLPASELRDARIRGGIQAAALEEAITQFANAHRVSRSMVAYRLYLANAISEAEWRATSRTFRRQWLEQRDRKRANGREAASGPDYYVVRRHRLGSALLRTTARLLSAGTITTVKAGQVLGVKPNNVQTLVSGISGHAEGAR